MRLLDLFCGAGGAAVGYHRAGFTDIVGVDVVPQPDFPFRFVQADALEFLGAMLEGQEDRAWTLVHASPPCQAFSPARHRDDHPDLVAATRSYLEVLDVPWVMENVPQAPMRRDLMLCGSMFDLDIRRHRVFEMSTGPVMFPPQCHHRWSHPKAPFLVAGHGGGWNLSHRNFFTLSHGKELMGMPWVTKRRGLVEAIPPAYTEWIGRRFLEGNIG